MGEHKLGSEFDKPDRASFQVQFAKKFIDDNGIKMTIRPVDEKELAAALAKTKKKAQIYATLDLPMFQLWVRIGTTKLLIGSKDFDSLRDNGKEREVLNKLADSTKLITRAEVDKWHDTHYDSQELSFFAETIREMEESQKKLQKRHDDLKAFTFADKNATSLRGELHAFTKKHSWEHYLQFVEDIEDGKGGQQIFDTYVRDGATLPVNLPPEQKAALAKQLSSHSPPDFGPAKTLIVKLINAKFIPAMSKDEMASLTKELQRLKTEIPEKKKEFIRVGGKP
jgi:hypothetical protein